MASNEAPAGDEAGEAATDAKEAAGDAAAEAEPESEGGEASPAAGGGASAEAGDAGGAAASGSAAAAAEGEGGGAGAAGSSSTAAGADTDLPAAYALENTSPAVRAVLEGTASCDDGMWRFAGRWRLRWGDALTSEFEWRSAASSGTSERPCAGNYEGYFHMLTPTGQARYEETELRLNFAENAEGGFNVEGDGKNDFGLFGIRGIVYASRSFQFLKLASEPVVLTGTPGSVARSAQWVTAAHDLIRYASGTPRARWFRKPVGPVCITRGHETVWYSDVIKAPMDFQTLRDNLKAQQYASLAQFVSAARLIFNNAWIFNRPGEACYMDADAVAVRFERRLSQVTGEAMPQWMEEVEQRMEEASKTKSRKRPPGKTAEELALGGPRRIVPRAAASRAKRREEQSESPDPKGGKGKSEGDDSENEGPRKAKVAKVVKGEGLKEELHKAHEKMAQLEEHIRELRSDAAKPRATLLPDARHGGRGAGRGPRRKEKAADAVQQGGGRGGGRKGGQAGSRVAVKAAKVEEDDFDRPLTENEKEMLQARIDLLDEESLEKVLDFLSGDLNTGNEADAEVQLDVEILPPARQRALVDFVEVQLRKLPPSQE